jgi:hypothetical protein
MEEQAMRSHGKLKLGLLGLAFTVVLLSIPSTFSNEPAPVVLEKVEAEVSLLEQGELVVDEPQVQTRCATFLDCTVTPPTEPCQISGPKCTCREEGGELDCWRV